MKSIPFMIRTGIPYDISEGNVIEIDGQSRKVVKIKSIKFLDMRTIEVIGLSKDA
ncbi:hypothetical protein AB1K09_20375 [Solibacillus silvestris]